MSESSDAKSSRQLFSSLIAEIKSYDGSDPLLPWLRGVKKMKEVLPPQLLKEKLPRFLQKCAETFITDRRYSNDLRYLRVWVQLMDFVEEPRAVLKTMEMNRIGLKKSLFYQAYALYYEKMKKFDAAERIYHLGVQNLAEPADELQKSYDQFLHRLVRRKNKRIQLKEGKTNKGGSKEVRSCKDNFHRVDGQPANMRANIGDKNVSLSQNEMPTTEASHAHMAAKSSNVDEEFFRKAVVSDSVVEVKVGQDDHKRIPSDDTAVARFVDTAIVGKSSTEDARHHGLIEPTINTKEAMNAINSMFREPIEPSISGRRRRNQSSIATNKENRFSVFADESIDSQQSSSEVDNNQPHGDSFEIYVDGEETDDAEENINGKGTPVQDTDTVERSSSHATVFARPTDHPSECSKDPNPRRHGFREDTVVYRFVGSTISDEPEVENVWHHGLVDPTINLKEAMNDINSMFGKPIEFTRKRRPRKYDESPDVKDHGKGFLILPDGDDDEEPDMKADAPLNMASNKPESRNKESDEMNNLSGFLILPDDDSDNQQESSLPTSSTGDDSDLFEQTVCTKEAMDEINKLFAMPMDF